MESTRQVEPTAPSGRHFREQGEAPEGASPEVTPQSELPLEVNMTDEPGGDPYNHTGNFKRLYR